MQNESSRHENVSSLGDHRRPRAGFSYKSEPTVQPEPTLALLPDMSHTNGRGVVEMVAKVLQQHAS